LSWGVFGPPDLSRGNMDELLEELIEEERNTTKEFRLTKEYLER